MERPRALRAAAVVPEHVRGGLGLHAAAALRAAAGPHPLQGSGLHAKEEVQENGATVHVGMTLNYLELEKKDLLGSKISFYYNLRTICCICYLSFR